MSRSDMPKTRRAVLAGASAAGAVSALAARAQMIPEPVVQTRAGALRGHIEEGVQIFKGVPYGEPTGGKARFLPPTPKAAWTGVRDATAWGERAPQLSQAGQIVRDVIATRTTAPGVEPQGEDCLMLNVYSPFPKGAGKRPVMVWYHGGGFASGSGGPGYAGDEMARRHGLVMVSVNHRLNCMGYLDLSQFGAAYAQSGNAGSLDMVLALRWVHDNIAAFGGDPGNVTIFGHSGGGAKISNLMAMPSAHGLFHRAIAQSGAVVRAVDAKEAGGMTRELLAKLKVSGHPIAALQALPANDLLEAMAAMGATGNPASTTTNFGPTVDGKVLPHHPGDPQSIALSAKIPLMVGSTREETRSFYIEQPGFETMTMAGAAEATARQLHISPARVRPILAGFRELKPNLSPNELYIEATSQQMFGHSSWLTAERRAAGGAPATWLYRIDWKRPGAAGARLAANHGIEVRLILGKPTAMANPAEQAEVERMRSIFMETWANFARTGKPSAAGLPTWPTYDGRAKQALVFDNASHLEALPSPALAKLSATLPDFHP